MKKLVLAAALAASALVSAPAAAASFIVTLGNAPIAVPNVNNFKGNLASLQLTLESLASTIAVDGPGKITFHFLGSESFFNDTFNFPGVTSYTETSLIENHFAAPIVLGQLNVDSGPLQVSFTSNGPGSRSAAPGDAGFAVFLPTGTQAGGTYSSNVIYFGFDDKVSFDDNHDDFIVRATISAIPEPATWAMMIGGFGLVGASVRRGRGMKAVTA